jgi:Ca2+-binding RTX toxin-like protein
MHRFGTLLIGVFAALAIPAAAQAGTLKVQAGVVSYTDTSTSDANIVSFGMSADGTRITVSDSGVGVRNRPITVTSDGSCVASATTGSCALAGVTSIAVDAGPLNDVITQGTSLPSRLVGGAGNDTIGGGPGDDVFPTDAGADAYAGGAGTDSADYSTQTASVSVSLDGAAGDGSTGENDNAGADIEVVIGGSGNDSLTANDADNILRGGAGDDTLFGAGGRDQLDGGAGADTLTGGDGVDTATYAGSTAGVSVVLDAQPGDGAAGENDNVDTEDVVGSAGDDILIGNRNENVLTGGDGNDRLLGGKGADTLKAGPGDDILQSLDGTKDIDACGAGEDGVVSDRKDLRTACDYIKYRPLAASSTAVHVRRGAVRVPVRCSPATVVGCHGRIALKAGSKTLGTRTYRLTSGRRWVARIELSRKGLAYVARRRVTRATLVVRDADTVGDRVRTTQTIRIGH